MIIRRFVTALRQQDWTTVAIELVIVAVGVFLGIQAANWNDIQAEKRLGNYYRQNLISDFQRNRSIAAARLSYYQQVLASIEQTDRLLTANQSDAEALIVAAYRASEVNNTPLNKVAWEQIVASGNTRLLRHPDLERLLIGFYRTDTSPIDARLIASSYRDSIRSLIPLPVQLAIRKGCSDELDDFNISRGFVTECDLSLEPNVLSTTAELIRNADDIHEGLRAQYSLVAMAALNAAGSRVSIEHILQMLSEHRP